MSICGVCGQEMLKGISCVARTYEIAGADGIAKSYAPVRFGDEAEDWGAKSGRGCRDCGSPPGGFHHPFCDVERCPVCSGQLFSCDCSYVDDPYVASTHDKVTLDFYANEATGYAARSDRVGTSKTLTAFLAQLPPNGAALDLGCGTGRDTQAIIDSGFNVTAIDGSAEMAREAEKRIVRPVRVLLFEDLDYLETFDGIWANASLLHVPRAGLAHVLSRVYRALKPGGLLFASFKSGGKEGRDELGRYYNYLNADELTEMLRANSDWATIEIGEGRSTGYDGKESGFIFCNARKAG